MNYTKYTDEEILDTYETMIAYSGKAESDIIAEIERRGGISNLQKACNDRKIIPDEIKRIQDLVFSMMHEKLTPEEINNKISSSILSEKELKAVISNEIKTSANYQSDISIGFRTIIGGIAGIVISCSIGVFIWKYSIAETGEINYILSAVVLLISYIIIRLLTGQTLKNFAVV
ncbi:MAG: hypothetical protein ACRC3B_21130, partial [Bacteroidia bacterium]